MPSVKDLEYRKFVRDINGNIVFDSNGNPKILVQASIDNHSIDSFGRLRISQSLDLFDSKLISNKNPGQFNEVTAGAGAITYSYQTSSVNLSISQANNDRSLRESRYLFYVPGKGQNVVITGVLAENSSDDIYAVVRDSTSGSIVNTKIHKNDWDDSVDGSGGSGISIDFTKAGIFIIDFQWLGVGKVKFNLVQENGNAITLYENKNSFLNDNVYIRSASLPVRYEIVSDGSYVYRRFGYFNDNDGLFFESRSVANIGTYNLKQICCSVSSDGGIKPSAIVYHANTRGNTSTATTTGVNVLIVKLLDSYKTNENRHTANLLSNVFFADDQNTMFEVYKVTSWVDNGSTWTPANTESACEFASGANINITVTNSHMVACSVVAANSSGSKADSGSVGVDAPFDLIDENRIIKQNYDSTQSELFLIKAYTMASTTTVGAAMTWLESE